MTTVKSPPAPVDQPGRVARFAGILDRATTLDVRSLALFRIALGAILLADFAWRLPGAPDTLAPDGMLPPDLVRRFVGHPWSWSVGLWCDAAWWNHGLLLAEAICGVALVAGRGLPWSTTAAWIVIVSLVRRTAPMTNSGDVYLAVLLFWAQFLPLAGRGRSDSPPDAAADTSEKPRPCPGCRKWKTVIDDVFRGVRGIVAGPARSASGEGRLPRAECCRGPAALALTLQVAAVYLSAGLAKWNGVWWSGDAIGFALSVHDHGTAIGDLVAGWRPGARVLSWSTVALELAGPPLLLVPSLRTPLVATFVVFHLAIAATMDVCLFPWVGIAAWLALLPRSFWDHLVPGAETAPGDAAIVGGLDRPRTILCGAAMVIAAAAFLHSNGPWHQRRMPAGARHAVQLTFLEQDWRVFGEIRPQRQWVYARADLANGAVVDVLRAGKPLETVLPGGGFHSIGDQRLQKLLWELPKPEQRVFAGSLASVLAGRWNAAHDPAERIMTLEIHGARMVIASGGDTLQDVLMATWPPRSTTGRGNLERFLRDVPPSRDEAGADASGIDGMPPEHGILDQDGRGPDG